MYTCAYCKGNFRQTTYYKTHRLGFCIKKPDSGSLEADLGESTSGASAEGDHIACDCEHCGQSGLCKWAYQQFHKATGCVGNPQAGHLPVNIADGNELGELIFLVLCDSLHHAVLCYL